MNKKRILISIGLLLMAAALALTVYNLRSGEQAGKASQMALKVLRTEIPEVQSAAAKETPDEAYTDENDLEEPVFIQHPEAEMPVLDIAGQNYLGILSIPKLNLTLPVIPEYSDTALRIAPCRYAGSAYEDDLVVAGHNYIQHFARLRELAVGDSVQFTDVDGNVFSYTVSEVEQLLPEEVERMVTGDWDLTLFTCTVSRQHRVTIRCERNTEPT